MRISYDPEVDALSIIFRDTTVTTQALAEGVAADYDDQGRLVGIEILDVVKQLGDLSVLQQVILERLGPAISFLRADREASNDIL
jgi:YD repeat-containing protein